MPTATDTETYVVRVDLRDRPFMRTFAEASSPDDALAQVQARLDADPESDSEVATTAEPLQPILARVIERVAAGAKYSLSFKHEDDGDCGPFGPVYITDLDAMRAEAEKLDAVRADGAVVLSVPFGSTPEYETPLPWMSRSEARRLAEYVGVPFGES